MPLRGNSEKQGDYMRGHLILGVSNSSPRVSAAVLMSCGGDKPPWLVGGPLRLTEVLKKLVWHSLVALTQGAKGNLF